MSSEAKVTLQEALRCTLEKEEESTHLYYHLTDKLTDAEGKELLRTLIEKKENYYQFLISEYKRRVSGDSEVRIDMEDLLQKGKEMYHIGP